MECDLKIRKATLLANTKEDFIKEFVINLPVHKLDKDFRKKFIKQLKANKGKKRLVIKALDYENQVAVDFVSLKLKVDVNNELIDFLRDNNLEHSVVTEISL